jgi:steroid delta-isomerase-like uncharacterized protein
MKLFGRRADTTAMYEKDSASAPEPQQTVRAFLDAYAGRDVEGALAVVAPTVQVNLHALGVRGGGITELRGLLEETGRAFPDLLLTIISLVEAGSVVAAEFKLEGTQAADYLGAINQEKHLDVDQVWRFTTDQGRITQLDGYWCQNQLYRRLAVKRHDQIAIV